MSLTVKVQHLLETRFSVRIGARPPERKWLLRRLDLLRQYCLPSVGAQQNVDFTWLLLCDSATDPEVMDALRAHKRELPMLRIATTGGDQPPLAAVRSEVTGDADVLITTRLDSDDAIADGYLAAIQEYASPFHRGSHRELLVNFPRGFRFDAVAGALYEGHMPNSSFHSFFERPSEPAAVRTVFSAGHSALARRYAGYRHLPLLPEGGAGWHARLHQHYPTHQDESLLAWLLVVHDGNLVNRIPATARPRDDVDAQLAGFTLRRAAPGSG